jgi:hypothetical protein
LLEEPYVLSESTDSFEAIVHGPRLDYGPVR